MQLEEWRPVIGWPYEVSESGRNPFAKLTEEEVILIRNAHLNGCSYAELAKMMNVSVGCIGDICRKKNWKHLLPENKHAIT
jgi:DNA invertase Pin-like site-specific DNA recombinase